MQVTHDAGGTLSNEEYILREVSLCREIFTLVWRYWTTLVAWFGCGVWAECRLFIFCCFFGTFFWNSFWDIKDDHIAVAPFESGLIASI